MEVMREMHDDTEEKVKRIMNRKMDALMAKVANELLEGLGSVKTVVKTTKKEVKNVEREVQGLETKQKDETEERMKELQEERTKASDEFRKPETKCTR